MPALTATRTFVRRSYLTRCRSDFLESSRPTARSEEVRRRVRVLEALHALLHRVLLLGERLDLGLALLGHRERFLCVSSCVMNFWITSFTSATPVASLISRNAAS